MSNFCILPWISIETTPLGQMRVCCLSNENIKNSQGKDFLIENTTLSNAFNSDYIIDLRKSFIKGEKPKSCNRCWSEEESGRTSKRQNSWHRLKNLVKHIDFSNPNNGDLIFLDLKLGNICNLKCRICGSFSSSKWAQEEIEINKNYQSEYHRPANDFLKQGQWPRKFDAFWNDLNLILPQIRYLEFTGGEPFLISEHFDFLQAAIDGGHASQIEIHYNTNGTHFPSNGPDLWKHFKLVEIALSIDDMGPRFEYQRYGANWNSVNKNLNKFRQLRDQNSNIILQLCLTVNALNFYYIDEILRWVPNQMFNYHYLNVVHDPFHFCIKHLNDNAKKLITDKLSAAEIPSIFSNEIQNLIQFMNSGDSTNCSYLKQILQDSDVFRKQHLKDHHPEIAAAIGYE
ncbi:twitch domain-containing radical SAM protein [bacterium]|nr:twitch domain-containing radical SAM protein [bacterium]